MKEPAVEMKLSRLLFTFLFLTIGSALACTDTVVTRDNNASSAQEEGGERQGGEEGGAKVPARDAGKDGQDASIAEIEPECLNHGDCASGACDKSGNRCVPCLREGETSLGCNAQAPACAVDIDDFANNRCVECVAHSDCGEWACDTEQNLCVECLVEGDDTIGCSDERPVCETAEDSSDNRCVQCLEHSDCESGACDKENKTCVACLIEDDEPIGCDAEGDTPVCKTHDDAEKNECVACLEHEDCASGVCDSSRNICVECLVDDDEAIGCDEEDEPLCKVDDEDSEENLCVQCLEMSDCSDPAASVCDADSNRCTPCDEDSDCEAIEDLPACNQGVCVECTDSELHCFDTTPICQDNECRACESHTECDFAIGVCNFEIGACYTDDEVLYVDKNSCSKYPSEQNGGREHPFCRVEGAEGYITEGSTERKPIVVLYGEYESFELRKRVRTWIIGKDKPVIYTDSSRPAITAIESSNAIIEGLEIVVDADKTGIKCEGLDGVHVSSTPNLVVRNVIVRGGLMGVNVINRCNFVLEDSEIVRESAGTSTTGVTLDSCSEMSEIEINDNEIAGYQYGMQVKNSKGIISIDGNIISHSSSTGVGISGGKGAITLSHNTISESAYAGIDLWGPTGPLTVDGNIVVHNNIGLSLMMIGDFEIINNIIANNGTRDEGGGVVLYPSTSEFGEYAFQNNTIVYNTSTEGVVAGVACFGAQCRIENSIVFGNSPVELTDSAFPWYCIVGDDSGGSGGAGNIRDKAPRFVSMADEDYHLDPDSPGVDEGRPDSSGYQLDHDLDGDSRPIGSRVDIGADEVK